MTQCPQRTTHTQGNQYEMVRLEYFVCVCVCVSVSEVNPDVIATEVMVGEATVGEVLCKRHSMPELPLSAALLP